ncbi:MAG: hypothetical protein IPH07_17280 [Deltaproteobacteria bacterium]|nr:hypothetical protein [Deltaproteobacteria bacterium]
MSVPRFQHGNHLDSASLELDGDAAVISYEEFHPFGTTSYAANDGAVEVSAKRYRYIGKERDEETGLYHLGARYYASWLGRWTAADPTGLADGVNRYAYCRGNPASSRDTSGRATEPIATDLRESHIAAMHAALLTAMAGGDVQQAFEEVVTTAAEATPVRPRKTTGEYEAAQWRADVRRLDAEDAEHYYRPEVLEFVPFMGLYDLPHDAAQAGAAWGMGDEARFENAAKKVAIDVAFTSAEAMTFFVAPAVRGGARLFANGASGVTRGSLKAAVGEARAAGRESVAAARVRAEGASTRRTGAAEPGAVAAGSGGPNDHLKRFGPGPESAADLAADAARAEAHGFPHGVSTRSGKKAEGPGSPHRSSPRSEVEEHFKVEQTGEDPRHHTVHLPKPVTDEVAALFNRLFRPKG